VPSPRRRNLVVLVVGQTVSLLGDYLAFFLALPVFVRDRTGSAASLGLLAAVETIAVLAFGLLAGVLLDRSSMRRAIVFADLARAVAFGLLALAVAGDAAETWMAFAVAFVVGSMSTVFDAGLQGYMPAVLADEDLPRANAALEFGRNIAMSTGFVLGGLVLAYAGGVAGALALDAATYVVSVLAVLVLVEVRPRARSAPEPMLGAIRTGVSFLWQTAPLRWATGAAVLTNFAFAPLAAVMTLYAEEDLGIVEEEALGIFFAMFSVLAALAATFAPRIMRTIGTGPTVAVGTIVFGLGAVGAGLVDGWWAVLPFGLATGGVSINNAAFFTLRQVMTPSDLLGRVIAASRTAAWAGIPLGAFLGGLLGDSIGLRPLFVGGGVAIVLVGLTLFAGPLGRRDATSRVPPVLD
jgi:MFS family permease